MAASADQKTEFIEVNDLDEKFLTCEICANLYKRPRILLCHHTFCQECLEEWAKVNRGRELTCPNCRQPWQVPVGGVEKLPANYYVNSLIDFVVESRKGNKESKGVANSEMCEYCESKAATSACLECSQLICDDCAKGHKRIRATAGHRVVSLEDYGANYENQPAKLKPSECDRHPGVQLEFYCQTCSVPICMKCTIVDHRVPEHQHIYLSEAAREGRVTITKSMKEVQSKLNYYNEKEAQMRKVKEDLTKNKDKTNQEIEKHTEKLVNQIRDNGKKMIRKADEIYEAKAKVLDSQLDRMELAKGQVKSSLEYSQSLVELGTDAGLMSVHKQTQEMLEGLLREEIQVEPQVNHNLQYSANPAFATGQQGSVSDNKAVVFQSVVKYKQPYAIVRNKALFQLVTSDVHGNEVGQGGAEVTAEVNTKKGERVDGQVTDNDNGTYDITFTPTKPGTHWLSVFLFGQPVKNTPVKISTLPLQTTRVIGGSQGEGPGQFNDLSGVAVSKVNDIYVADHDNRRIQVFNSHGEYQRHFTVDCGGERVQPWDVAFTREDHLLITDEGSKQVCVCDTRGNLLKWFGKGQFREPKGVAVGSDGHIHVADCGGTFSCGCVKTFKPEGGLVRIIGGQRGGQFNSPHSVAVNSRDQIIVSDCGNHRMQVFNSSGAFLFACGRWSEGEGELKGPRGVTVDQHDNIIVCDSINCCVQVFDSGGAFLFTFGRQGSGEGELKYPRGVAVDQHDNIIVCDEDNNRIVMFSPEGDYMYRVDDPGDGVKGPYAIATVPGQPLELIVTGGNQLRIME